jgi:hypothetical protein
MGVMFCIEIELWGGWHRMMGIPSDGLSFVYSTYYCLVYTTRPGVLLCQCHEAHSLSVSRFRCLLPTF